jgi:hypothetical protein
LFGKAVKVQADKSNPADVIIEGTLALTPEDNLLLKCFKNILEATYGEDGFLDNCGFISFFS